MSRPSGLRAILFGLGILIASADLFKNSHFVEKYVGVSSGTILFVLIVAFSIARLKWEKILPDLLTRFSLYSGAFLVAFACLLAVVGALNEANFVYSKTLINVDRLLGLGMFLLSIGIITQMNAFFKVFYRKILFFGGLICIIVFSFFSLLPANAVEQIIKEGHLIENSQFLVLVLASMFSFLFAVKNKRRKVKYLFYAIGVGLLFVAGDEIAWGQHFFGIQAPEIILEHNRQEEITIHNLQSLSGYVRYIYIAVGLYGSFAFLFIKNKLFAPDNYLFPYFFSTVIYNVLSFIPGHTLGIWSEPVELLLYSGVLFHLMSIYYQKITNSTI